MSTPIEELTALVDALRAETFEQSITPERMGAILQRMIDVLSSMQESCDSVYHKPNNGIPKSDLASGVQTSLDNADTAYQKPSGGIPKTDLASSVQASLDKADTAIQDISGKQDVLTFDLIPTSGSNNPVTSDGIKSAIDNLGTLDSEAIGLADVTLNIKFSLIQNLTDVTSSVDAESVNFGDELAFTLTPASGYTIRIIRVLMGGVDITETAYSSNVVYIEEVTGDVSITAIGVEQGVVPLEFADPNVAAVILANFPHENEGFITEGEALEITSLNGKFKGNTDITSFDELPKFGVTSLANEEFMGCSSLESIDISKISAMGNYCFSGCTALETINLGSSSVTELGRNTFYGCSSLESIDISKINSIGFASEGNAAGYDCFRGCSSLTSIKTNNNVTKVPNNCFRDCTALATIDLGSSVVTLGSNAATGAGYDTLVFRSTTPPNFDTSYAKNNTTLYVPDAAFSTYQADANWGTKFPATVGGPGRVMKPLSEYVED